MPLFRTTIDGVTPPRRASKLSAGVDFFPVDEIIIPAKTNMKVNSHVRWNRTQRGYGVIMGRSSLTWRGLFVTPGIIDGDFKGEFIFCFYNNSLEAITWEPHKAMAQMLLFDRSLMLNGVPYVPQLRGFGGFGSTVRETRKSVRIFSK